MVNQESPPAETTIIEDATITTPSPKVDPLLAESPRIEVSASALARMMGVATVTELKLLEGKVDLLSTRVSTMTSRLEKVIATFNKIPSGSDLERIDVQIGALRSLIKESLLGGASMDSKSTPAAQPKKPVAAAPAAVEEAVEPTSSE